MKKASRGAGRVTEPSAASLREIPELGPKARVLGRGAAGLRKAKEVLGTKRGGAARAGFKPSVGSAARCRVGRA